MKALYENNCAEINGHFKQIISIVQNTCSF